MNVRLFRFRLFSTIDPLKVEMVRFIDAEGKNYGMVLKDSILVPTGYQLTQVAPNVFKLLQPKTPAPAPSQLEATVKPNIIKTIQMRPAIAPPDLERMLERVRIWLDSKDHKRVSAVNILIRREGGAKARARGVTADALLDQVVAKLQADGFKPANIKKEGMQLSCLYNKVPSK